MKDRTYCDRCAIDLPDMAQSDSFHLQCVPWLKEQTTEDLLNERVTYLEPWDRGDNDD